MKQPLYRCSAFLKSCAAFLVSVAGITAGAEVPVPPHSVDGTVKISLLASEPDVVTPIGATIDAKGRLLVIESNSHFRPKDYKGRAADRILRFDDTNAAGKSEHISTVYEGGPYVMNLAADADGSLVVSSRNEIFRLQLSDDLKTPPTKKTIAALHTTADYPHNGLHGLALRGDTVYFGIGENYGAAWTLSGTDGASLSDDRGAGAIFQVDRFGHGLTRVSRGFWNPFGLGVDPLGNVWVVDNDPDGRPPCRLVLAESGADYGYEFRYGRTGMHPLQAWDGELPGTLGMVAGVGEAPCAVVFHDGRLYVSSWRDHIVQSFELIPRGASYTTQMRIVAQGNDDFRPVGLAFAPDGALFVTDWASSSYPVHGKGRVWKLTFNSAPSSPAQSKPSAEMLRADALRKTKNVPPLLEGLDDADPYIAQAAQFGLSQLAECEKISWSSLHSARQHIGLLAGMLIRGADCSALIDAALKDSDDRVRQMGVRAVAEQGIKQARTALDQLLQSQALSPRLLGMTIATINQLDGDPKATINSGKINSVLLARINAPQATETSRTEALHMLQASHPAIPVDQLKTFVQSSSHPLQLEAARYLSADRDSSRFALLSEVASNEKAPSDVRAEAIDGLSTDPGNSVDLLLKLIAADDAVLRDEALRSIAPVVPKLSQVQRDQIADAGKKHPTDAQLVDRVLGRPISNRPAETDIAGWQKILDAAPGDPEAGRRIFFHPAAAGCARCHMIEGRGRQIGPDLTMIGHSQSAQHVLESILDPSKEIAPLFTLWTITLRDGQHIDGMLLRRDGQQNEVYVDASGVETVVKEPTVADRKIRKESLMPTGLVQGLTDQELRDLVAFLVQKR